MARKHIPIFRVVLTDSKNSTKSGKFKEVLGTYNLVTDEKRVDADRVKYWLSKGAQPSGTVHNYLVSERIIEGKKINVLPRRRPIKKEAPASHEASQGKSPASPEATQGKPAESLKSHDAAAQAPEAKTEPAAEAKANDPTALAAVATSIPEAN